MKNLKELEQKYLELGKEIEALKNQVTEKKEFNYPIYCKCKQTSLVVKFTELGKAQVVVRNEFHDITENIYNWEPHTNTDVWQQLDVCEETGFFDGQLVWCWDYNNAHYRTLKFYDAKNECTYCYDGTRAGDYYCNYEPFKGNYPDWALEAFQTLER